MIRVNYYAKNFGNIGYDVFVNDNMRNTLGAVCHKLSEQIGEKVYYGIVYERNNRC